MTREQLFLERTRRHRAGDRLGLRAAGPARSRRRRLRLGGQDAAHRERLRDPRQVPGPQLAQDLPDGGHQPPLPGLPGAALRQVAPLGRGAPAGDGGAPARAPAVPRRAQLRRGLRCPAERPARAARRATRSTPSASGCRSGRAASRRATTTSPSRLESAATTVERAERQALAERTFAAIRRSLVAAARARPRLPAPALRVGAHGRGGLASPSASTRRRCTERKRTS